MCEKNELCLLVDYKNNKYLCKNGVSFHWWTSEPTSLHSHNFYEFFIVTSGSATHEINGNQYTIKKGTMHIIRPEDHHKIKPLTDDCIHMNISVTPEKLRDICTALSIDINELILCKPRIRLGAEEFEFFKKRAERISFLQYSDDEKFHIIICEIISQAVSIVYKNSVYSALEYPEWFADVLDKIHSPAYCACSAEDVYRLASFSPPVLIEYFKQYTGKTVTEYIRTVKMNRACEFLKTSDISILELSNMLGYASLSHFNRIFKNHTGVTPSVYRKEKNK